MVEKAVEVFGRLDVLVSWLMAALVMWVMKFLGCGMWDVGCGLWAVGCELWVWIERVCGEGWSLEELVGVMTCVWRKLWEKAMYGAPVVFGGYTWEE